MTSNLESLFISDYYGAKWQVNDHEVRVITWSTVSNSLKLPNGEYVAVATSLDDYTGEIRKAFQIWDNAIESIKFVETNSGNMADVTIAATYVDGIENAYGHWDSSWYSNKSITKGTIQFDSHDLNNGWLLTTAMHEVGNILGLGDLADSTQYKSVQEDPFPEKFLSKDLWDYDKYLVNQVYTKTEPEPAPQPEPEPYDGIIELVGGKGKFKGTSVADAFTFDSFDVFTKKAADKIIGFDESQGDTIAVSQYAFPALQGASEIHFASTNNKKELKLLSRQDYDFVYFEKKGRLYFDGNGSDKNWGKANEGGLVAVLSGKPELTVDNFTLLV